MSNLKSKIIDAIQRDKYQEALKLMYRGELLPSAPFPYGVGDQVFIRAVTYHFVGKIKAIHPRHVVLDPCHWVADSGPFGPALAEGLAKQSETEPYPGECSVALDCIVDVSPYRHDLNKVGAKDSD